MKILVNSKLSEHRYKTPEGYLVCVDSVLARTGKQTYRRDELFHDNNTTEIEVDRPENEVFSEQTLASFENKPLTIEHPEEDVNPHNHKTYAVGFVRDIKRGTDNGEPVMLGTLVVTDEDAIKDIEDGKLPELSCGYDCDIADDDNPQQRNIRGNHVALCEHGRAGNARIVDSVKDNEVKVWQVHAGYVVVAEKYWKQYGKNTFIDRREDSLESARYVRSSLERNDGMSFVIVDCNDNKYKVVDSKMKDIKPIHKNIREQIVYVMQSNIDKNLFFYIGKNYAMKEGDYTYQQYDMEGMTPDELRKELEANGWHKVARGPAPFIDEDPYEKSTKGLEEAEKKLHDEMTCNTETDCKDAKTEYVFNYQDTYHGTRDKMRVDANNLDEAIREFGKTMALGGYGTANIYVINVSPNDGYMRTYGKLSEMLKQKWTRDSAKKLDSKKLLSIIKAVDSIKTSDRLAPSQYKALRELGYNESKWKNMTSEEASKIIAAAKQKKEGKSEKKEEAKTETSKQSSEQTSESSSSKLANEEDFLNFTDKLGLNFESAESLNGKGVLATMTRGNPRSFNRQRDKHYDKLKAAGMYALAGKYSDQFYVFESKEDMQQYATNELSNNVDSVSNKLSKYLDKDAVEEIKKSMLNSTNSQYAKDNPFNLINAIGDIKIKENDGELSIDLGDKSWVGNYSYVVEQAFRNKYGYPTSESGNRKTYKLK